MALNKAGLISALTTAFTPSEGSSPEICATAIANAIDAYVKTATVVPTAFVVTTAPGAVTGTGSLT